MTTMLIFGLGYTASRLARRLRAQGWRIIATRRAGDSEAIAFDDEDGVRAAIAAATHILSSVPPDAGGRDPVLDRYGALVGEAPARWVGYLSSTGVYGDTAGAWVDESAAIGTGRRSARAEADAGVSSVPMSGPSACPASTGPAARRWSACQTAARNALPCPDRSSAASMSTTL